MMTSAQVVEKAVTLNSPSQDYTHLDDCTPLSYDMTPGFNPFTIVKGIKKLCPLKYNKGVHFLCLGKHK